MHRSTHLKITLTQGNRTLVKVKGRGGGGANTVMILFVTRGFGENI